MPLERNVLVWDIRDTARVHKIHEAGVKHLAPV